MARVPVMSDKAFPRGGTKPRKQISKTSNFGVSQLKKKKGKKKRKVVNRKEKSDAAGEYKTTRVEELTNRAVKPGMLLLGSISSVNEKQAELSLPGGMRAVVTAAYVSDTYTRRVLNHDETIPFLTGLFTVDDLYPLKIISETERSANLFKATLEPREINGKLTHSNLHKGMTLSGEVTSREDHGYVVSLGIANTNSFILNKKAPKGAAYHEGQVVRCAVMKVTGHSVTLSTLPEDLDAAVLKEPVPIECFIPGIKFSLNVSNCRKSGLEVSLTDQNSALKGYVYFNHLRRVFDNTSSYEAGSTIDGILLYVVPLVNYPFFKIAEPELPLWKFSYGDIVRGKVYRVCKSGLYLKAGPKFEEEKCYVPIHRLNNSRKLLDGSVALKDLFQAGQIIPRVRIEHSSRFSRFYFGATNKDALDAEIFSLSDLQVGMVVTCKLLVVGDKYSTVDLGNSMKGFISHFHMTENATASFKSKFKEGQRVKARILSTLKNRISLTLKPNLVNSEDPILVDPKTVQPGCGYLGTISHIFPDKLDITFYGGLSGTALRRNLPIDGESPIQLNYYIGQVVKCYVIGQDKYRLKLSLVHYADVGKLLTVGYEYPVVVESVASDGVYVEVKARGSETCRGFIPLPLLSRHSSLISPLVDSIREGDKFKAYCIHLDPLRSPPSLFTIHSVITTFLKNVPKGTDPIVEGAIVPFLYLPGDENISQLTPVVNHSPSVKFVIARKEYSKYQEKHKDFDVVLGKIKYIRKSRIVILTDVKEVWDHHFMSSLKDLNDFLEEVDSLQKRLSVRHTELARFQLGKEVVATCERICGDHCLLRVGKCGLECRSWKIMPAATNFKGRVIWISYDNKVAWIHPDSDDLGAVTQEKRSNIRARVIHVCPEVVVTEAVGSRELVFIPTRRHFNDSRTYEHAYNVGEITKLRVFRLKTRLLGIDRQIVTKQGKGDKKVQNEDSVSSESTPARKKRKIVDAKQKIDDVLWDADVESSHSAQESGSSNRRKVVEDSDEDKISIEFVKGGSGVEPDSPVKQEVFSDDEVSEDNPLPTSPDSDLEVKEETGEDVSTGEKDNGVDFSSDDSDEAQRKTKVSLDVGFDWSLANNSEFLSKAAGPDSRTVDSSSGEEVLEDNAEKKKRKRLTGSERKEKAKEIEDRLRHLEERRLDPTRPPQSPDDFDRLVMATPDDSSTWLQYMAHHLENTEIEKARAVARRALKTINIREEQEKLNIWFALLNLEQLYGTTESQKIVFEEALRSNDSYKVYLHKLSMLANGGASVEVEQLANVMLRKFKEEESVWWEVGGLLMKVGKIETARNVLQRAMTSLPNSKHVNLISRFAQLENKYGSSERAQTLYEHILSAFSKRVDVWSAYADLMVKSNRLDLARKILERATSQSLPPKKMKILFKKFLAFEEAHGTAADIDRVRSAAGDYLDGVAGNE